jgi:hypothetical protein
MNRFDLDEEWTVGWSPSPDPWGVDDAWSLDEATLLAAKAGAGASRRAATVISTPGRVVIYPSAKLADFQAYRAQCQWTTALAEDGLCASATESSAEREARWRRLWSWAAG